MLVIKNIDKIRDRHIKGMDINWYVHIVEDVVLWDLNTKENWNVYIIRIRNYINNEQRDIQLNRQRLNKRWYKLSCVRGIYEKKELITRYTINDIDRLLDIIRLVAIDN